MAIQALNSLVYSLGWMFGLSHSPPIPSCSSLALLSSSLLMPEASGRPWNPEVHFLHLIQNWIDLPCSLQVGGRFPCYCVRSK